MNAEGWGSRSERTQGKVPVSMALAPTVIAPSFCSADSGVESGKSVGTPETPLDEWEVSILGSFVLYRAGIPIQTAHVHLMEDGHLPQTRHGLGIDINAGICPRFTHGSRSMIMDP